MSYLSAREKTVEQQPGSNKAQGDKGQGCGVLEGGLDDDKRRAPNQSDEDEQRFGSCPKPFVRFALRFVQGRRLVRRLAAKLEQFGFGQHAVGLLGAGKDSFD